MSKTGETRKRAFPSSSICPVASGMDGGGPADRTLEGRITFELHSSERNAVDAAYRVAGAEKYVDTPRHAAA